MNPLQRLQPSPFLGGGIASGVLDDGAARRRAALPPATFGPNMVRSPSSGEVRRKRSIAGGRRAHGGGGGGGGEPPAARRKLAFAALVADGEDTREWNEAGEGVHAAVHHCELQPIERLWAMVKVYCKRWSQWTLGVMMDLIDESMKRVTSINLRLFIGLARKYEEVYEKDNTPADEVPRRIRDIGINEALKSGKVRGVTLVQIEAMRKKLASTLRETPACVAAYQEKLKKKGARLAARGGGRVRTRPAVPGKPLEV